jgi:hypothetical protein
MKRLLAYLFIVLGLLLSGIGTAQELSSIPFNEPLPKGVTYRGVNEEQWKKIKEIGDPLNCGKRVFDFQKINNFKIIGPLDCENDINCINNALRAHKSVKLKQGKYQIYDSIYLNSNTLIGEGNVMIDASNVSKGVIITNPSTLANLRIDHAQDIGVDIYARDSLIYRIVASNTGVKSFMTSKGHGFSVVGSGNKDYDNYSLCIVSAESFNGYNTDGSSKIVRKGGNADGFQVKYGASDITFIDTHAHHNSDDGFDFWKGGIKSENPAFRIFYSSSNYNGRHPTKPNGDGNGFKFGSSNNYQKLRGKDEGDRLIYGSVACKNKNRGFDRNKSPTKIISLGNEAKGNKENYKDVRNKKVKDDLNVLKCKMFYN